MSTVGPNSQELKPRITVIGVGGGGCNAVNNMMSSGLEGVAFVACNTDSQALHKSSVPHKIQLGFKSTQGLGAGSNPETGRLAAEETLEEITASFQNTHMLFITAGMGGGTGTGGTPVIARAAREMGILTVGVVTKPFHFEGTRRMEAAEQGIEEMHKNVDTLLVIPNQNLFCVATERTTFSEAFLMADEILHSGVRTFTDLMIKHGLINLDFADISTVMRQMSGKAMMGTGQSSSENRSIEASEAAISCPLLDDVSMKGATAVLINVTGGEDMTLFEVDEAANRIREEVDAQANIIFGAAFDESLKGHIRVSVVATGIHEKNKQKPQDPVSTLSSRANLPGSQQTAQGNLFDDPASELSNEKSPAPKTPYRLRPSTETDFFKLAQRNKEKQEQATDPSSQNPPKKEDAPSSSLSASGHESGGFFNEKWGQKHDLSSLNYAQQDEDLALELKEMPSPFSHPQQKDDGKESFFKETEEGKKTTKTMNFFEKLTGTAKRHHVLKEKDAPQKELFTQQSSFHQDSGKKESFYQPQDQKTLAAFLQEKELQKK